MQMTCPSLSPTFVNEALSAEKMKKTLRKCCSSVVPVFVFWEGGGSVTFNVCLCIFHTHVPDVLLFQYVILRL